MFYVSLSQQSIGYLNHYHLMSFFYYAFSFLLVFLISCNSSNLKDNENFSSLRDSIYIKIDSVTLDYYTLFSFDETENELYAYNRKTHALDIFNLNRRNISGHLQFNFHGPNAVSSEVEGIFFSNTDSIFLKDRTSIYIIKKSGRIISQFKMSEDIKDDLDYVPLTNSYFRLLYAEKSHDVYFFNLYPTHQIHHFLDSSVVSCYNIKSRTIRNLPITFSKYYDSKKGRLGYFRYMNFESSRGDNLIFSSQFDDEVIEYNYSTNKANLRSIARRDLSLVSGLPVNASDESWTQHSINSTIRFGFLYDPWRDLYYRFLWNGVETRASENIYNTMMDKPFSVEIYDTNLNFLGEDSLPINSYRPSTWFITKEGLNLFHSHPLSEEVFNDSLRIDIIKYIVNE